MSERALAVCVVLALSGCMPGMVGALDDAGSMAGGDGETGGGAGGGGTATGGGDATGGGMATGGGTATGGGDATGGGTATGGGGGSTTDAGLDAGSDRVPAFIAVGKQGRRAISCDDGLTWKNDVSVDDAWPENERYRCFSGDLALPDGGTQSTDCDHNAYSSTSLAVVGDSFVQTMGWGAPGTFHRTTNGIDWQQVFTGANVQDVMFGNGRAIAATRYSRRSDDLGATWSNGAEIPLSNGSNTIWNVRGGVFGGTGTGAYLVVGQDGSNTDFAYSLDQGATWQRPSLQGGGRIDACGSSKPASGGGLFVTMTWNNSTSATIVCRSADNAVTWTSTTIAEEILTRPLWTGTEFVAWSAGKRWRSTDGTSWTSTNTQTRVGGTSSGGPRLGAVALGASGTFVGVKGGWQVWYEQQRFYRSTDGLTWDELPEASAKRGHPITAMAAGTVARSAVCP